LVAAAGAVLVLIAALANVLGIGNSTEFGARQISGVIGGVIAIIIGTVAVRWPRR
jgi:hypothetical protein